MCLCLMANPCREGEVGGGLVVVVVVVVVVVGVVGAKICGRGFVDLQPLSKQFKTIFHLFSLFSNRSNFSFFIFLLVQILSKYFQKKY